jgi:hypothetical protein
VSLIREGRHLDPVDSVRDLAVIAPPGGLLALVEGAVVRCHDLENLTRQSVFDLPLVLLASDGRAHHVLCRNLRDHPPSDANPGTHRPGKVLISSEV